MSTSNLVVITGQIPAIQSQIQVMLADYFACCTVPLADTDTLSKISKLSHTLILVADENTMTYLAHTSALSKMPTLAILNQPSPALLQQAYQSGVSKVLIWPKSKEELQVEIKQCIPQKSWMEWLKIRFNAWINPSLQIQNAIFLRQAQHSPLQSTLTTYQISLLGELSIRQGQFQLRPHTQREQELLGYLLLNYPRPIKREKLCAALWPGIDAESARNRLNVLIHRMRKGSCKDQGVADWLVYDSKLNAYHLSTPDPIQIDVHEYQNLLAELKTQQDQPEINIQICKKIVELHQGELLEGIEHSEWIDRQRLDIQEKLQSIILRLADYFLKKNIYAQAIYYCRRGVDLDPCLEAIQQRLIFALALNGDREAAIRAYRRFEQTRIQEFVLAPSASSKALLALIEDGTYESLHTWFNQLTSKN